MTTIYVFLGARPLLIHTTSRGVLRHVFARISGQIARRSLGRRLAQEQHQQDAH
jgi:hypothetical protein